jgi:hypothetical protein
MTLTAEQIFNQAMDAEYDRKDLVEAIVLYHASALAYFEEGSEEDAFVAEFMSETVGRQLADIVQEVIDNLGGCNPNGFLSDLLEQRGSHE